MLNVMKAAKPAGFAVALLLAAAVLLACGDDDKDEQGSSGGTAGSTAATKKLSDCEYASALLESVETFSNSLTSVATSTVSSKENALKSLDTFDTEMGTLINQLKSYQLSSDVAKVNNGLIVVFEDVRKQIPDLKRAVESGDSTRMLDAISKFGQQVGPGLDKIEQENKSTTDKLNACT